MRRQPETRAHERAPYRETVRYFEWDKTRMAQGAEISAGGIFIQTPTPLPEGRLVTLRLTLPGKALGFTVLARVMRTVQGGVLRTPGMGLRFLDIPSSLKSLIEGYVAERQAA